jgi:hypothetical protein
MRRWFVAVAVALICVARVSADLTIMTATTLEGGMAAAAGGAPMPKIVTRIKGNKARTDIDVNGAQTSTIIDLATKQMVLLNHDDKTARIVETGTGTVPTPQGPMPMPKIDSSVKATGQKREVNGQPCAEYAVTMTMDMSSMGGRSDMPPEAAAMFKGLTMKMSGSTWVAKDAPGAAEYAKYQAAAAKVAMGALAAAAGGGGVGASGMGTSMPQGMEKLITGFAEAPGIAYLTELTMSVEGNSQIAAMMSQMGSMKIISRVTDVQTTALDAALFSVPADYKTIK